MKNLMKLVLVAVALGVTLKLVTSEKNPQVLTEDQQKIAERLKQLGYYNVLLREQVPSTDGALVMRFTATDCDGTCVNGTMVVLKEHEKIFIE